jgi:hypothetical protein
MSEPRSLPRFPNVPLEAGHYESYYVKASHPSEPQAFWLRHTVHKRPGELPLASLWLTVFDGARPGPVAGKQTFGPAGLRPERDGYVRVGESVIGPDGFRGTLRSPTLDAAWDLRMAGDEAPLRHFPADLMYRGPLPRTKTLSPHPAVRLEGRLTAGDREIGCDGWRGMVGHNWGAEHAERWIWLGTNRFAGHDDAWLDVALGRVKVGPVTLPWVGNGAVALDGRRHRLGGPRGLRGTRIEETPTSLRFALGGGDVRVEGEIAAPADQLVAWRYADPVGPEHHVTHSSVADLRLRVRRSGAPEVVLEAPGATTYELGMRETDHGLTLQPYADGEAA